MVALPLPYPVTIAAGALDDIAGVVTRVAPASRAALITDADVARHHGARAAARLGVEDAHVLVIPAGEQHKTRDTWARLTDVMLAQGYGRDTVVVALGGGVVGDLAGFVAATYMRGVPVVQVPTTLLAMVDASVGGKTGVDTPAGKNLVGAFHQPAAVVVDPALLATLPVEHVRAGFAEIIKHGAIADAAYFERVAAHLANEAAWRDPAALTPLIARSVEIKAEVVTCDEREAGMRKVLNFGHTIAHAIETATGYGMLHGNAVAIGMVIEARIAERIGVAKAGTADAIAELCRAAHLPTSPPAIPVDSLVACTRTDKKARAGRVEYALPERIGRMAASDRGWAMPVDDDDVRAALEASG